VSILQDQINPRAEMSRYGDNKGACEMIFSYGFLEDGMESARAMFLDLSIPDDDPLRMAKVAVANSAPGFLVRDNAGDITWEGDFIWLACVNEEDGLRIRTVQALDGSHELQATWKEHEFHNTSELETLLRSDPMWEVFHLRALCLLQERLSLQTVISRESEMKKAYAENGLRAHNIRQPIYRLVTKLRALEIELLLKAQEKLDDQVRYICSTKTWGYNATCPAIGSPLWPQSNSGVPAR
jgi:hypothetical protein